ncbi:MAG: response regulator [Pirellulaceae bacterium]|nr:response regulator [Pirellulaceae bacterium]
MLVAISVGVFFEPTFGDGFPFATMIVAVMISGWYGGFGPGLVTALSGAVALIVLVLNPEGWLSVSDVESQAGLLAYLVVTVGMATVCGFMRRAVCRAEQRTAEVVRALEEKLLVERSLNRTATQLERSDAFHRLVTELTSDFTFRLALNGQDGKLDYVSPGFVSITGYTLEQVQERGGWQSILHPDDVSIAVRTLQLAIAGTPDRSELRIINRQSQTCWIRYLTQPQRSPTGEVTGLVGAAQHITEQRRLEVDRLQLLSELAEKSAFIEAVLGQVPVGIVVADAATGSLVTTNREAQRVTGIDYQTGLSIDEVYSSNSCHGYRADGSEYSSGHWPMQRALRGEVIHDEKVTLTSQHRGPLHLSFNAGPITDREGNVIAAVTVFHDESQRRLSEEQVRESQRFLRCSLDSLSSHIAVLDETGCILEVNEAWRRFGDENNFSYFAYGVGSNYLAPFESETLQCGDGPSIASGIRDVIAGKREMFEFEYPCHSPTEQRWFLLRVTRFKTPGPTRVVIAHENVTKLREAMDLLREADRRKDEFLATLAHELRNPLAPICNAVQILKLPQCDEHSRYKTLEMIERQASQLTRLVDDLLDVSRVMRGKIQLRRERVDLTSVLLQAVETSEPLIRSKQHTLDLECVDQDLHVYADPIRLLQILCNLITNAAKYTEPQGVIKVKACSEGNSVVIRIRDNGIGIHADQLHGIFDLFMQVDHATTRAQGGLGIGLTLVKNLVELHEGSVRVSSAGLGHGSEFTVRMPLAKPEESKADQPHGPASGETGRATSQGCRVLVVDDNRDAANSLALLLRSLGHNVFVAHCGQSALGMAADSRPDVVFLDIGMPAMDGYEVARRLRADPANEEICLAALTGWGQAEDRRRTAEAGFDYHIVKPPELSVLLNVIGEAQSIKR